MYFETRQFPLLIMDIFRCKNKRFRSICVRSSILVTPGVKICIALKVRIPDHPSTTWCQKWELAEIMLFPYFP